MKTPRVKNLGLGITLRTALLSWLVTILTVLIFATVIIPLQKQTFVANLESKAHGIAASLGNVATGAVVNEDYAAVVDHCVQMLKGDSSIDHLVLTRNDGFALIHDRKGWRSDTLSQDWRPSKRSSRIGIGIIPLFNRRVFHYSQPFDYLGIQWGWIHVGLSLDTYDLSVAAVYRRTGLLAVLCILLSFAASVVYAKRLVRPILSLRTVVQKVAGGDLSARAAAGMGDEVGNLADSFNSMTEALLQRDRIVQSVRFAAQQFLSTTDWKMVIRDVLAKVGEAARVSRICVFENQHDEQGGLFGDLRYEWVAPGIRSLIADPNWQRLDVDGSGFGPWADLFKQREMVSAQTRELSPAQQDKLQAGGAKALIVLPIMVEGSWWGVLSLAECNGERHWTDAERDSIRAAADMLGAAIARQRTQDALLEAKETLEQQVQERTKELQEQVAAKERARADLAEAQQRLMQASRQAGMAEVATGVLHNVGNVLNSVNVSTTLIDERLRKLKLAGLGKAAQLLQEHAAEMGPYFTHDPKGKLFSDYVLNLGHHLEQERLDLLKETGLLIKYVEHIKDIVAMQQSYAKVSGVLESLPVASVVEDALQMNAAAFERHAIQVVRQYQEVPPVTIDKHKVLQTLLNLFCNAKYAMAEKPGPYERRLIVRIALNGHNRVKIAVQDNGVGINPENLTRIFSNGFTTKRDGHGFGLHLGALSAKEMGGSLTAHSDGPCQGATFTLELPITKERAEA